MINTYWHELVIQNSTADFLAKAGLLHFIYKSWTLLNNLASKIIAGKERFEREKKAIQFVQKYTGHSAALSATKKNE